MKNKILYLYILISIFILFTNTIPCYAKHIHKEKYYQNKWCTENHGRQEIILQDGTRADCITDAYAIEFDFAEKWAEAIGQALYYAIMTNKKPGIVLIMENPKKDMKYLNRLDKVAKKYRITVWTMNKRDVDNG